MPFAASLLLSLTVCSSGSARLLGVYEDFYADSLFGDEQTGLSTHYVVLGYEINS